MINVTPLIVNHLTIWFRFLFLHFCFSFCFLIWCMLLKLHRDWLFLCTFSVAELCDVLFFFDFNCTVVVKRSSSPAFGSPSRSVPTSISNGTWRVATYNYASNLKSSGLTFPIQINWPVTQNKMSIPVENTCPSFVSVTNFETEKLHSSLLWCPLNLFCSLLESNSRI